MSIMLAENPYGQALFDFFYKNKHDKLYLNNRYGAKEEMPVEVFFREEEDFSDLETYALSLCEGKVLDIGAGVGKHALFLQKNGMEVTALETEPVAVDIMRQQGLNKVVLQDIFDYNDQKYDTLLLMMNGIGLAGDIHHLKVLLEKLKQLLLPTGKVLLDSSDITYLYQETRFPEEKYYGEIDYQYEYAGKKGEWFSWLYIDEDKLKEIANDLGWQMQVIFRDECDQYLARLSIACL